MIISVYGGALYPGQELCYLQLSKYVHRWTLKVQILASQLRLNLVSLKYFLTLF